MFWDRPKKKEKYNMVDVKLHYWSLLSTGAQRGHFSEDSEKRNRKIAGLD